jgi:hypothetical protein
MLYIVNELNLFNIAGSVLTLDSITANYARSLVKRQEKFEIYTGSHKAAALQLCESLGVRYQEDGGCWYASGSQILVGRHIAKENKMEWLLVTVK